MLGKKREDIPPVYSLELYHRLPGQPLNITEIDMRGIQHLSVKEELNGFIDFTIYFKNGKAFEAMGQMDIEKVKKFIETYKAFCYDDWKKGK